MRHGIKAHHFNRDTKARKALFVALVSSLVEKGSIKTTQVKAKELKRQIDKILIKAQSDTLTNRRLLHRFFGKRQLVNKIYNSVMPALGDKKSGFAHISFDSIRRGDNTKMFKVSLYDVVIPSENEGSKKVEEQKDKSKKAGKTESKKKIKNQKSKIQNATAVPQDLGSSKVKLAKGQSTAVSKATTGRRAGER